MMEFVSWDDEIPNIWKVIKAMFQTTNQIGIWVKKQVLNQNQPGIFNNRGGNFVPSTTWVLKPSYIEKIQKVNGWLFPQSYVPGSKLSR